MGILTEASVELLEPISRGNALRSDSESLRALVEAAALAVAATSANGRAPPVPHTSSQTNKTRHQRPPPQIPPSSRALARARVAAMRANTPPSPPSSQGTELEVRTPDPKAAAAPDLHTQPPSGETRDDSHGGGARDPSPSFTDTKHGGGEGAGPPTHFSGIKNLHSLLEQIEHPGGEAKDHSPSSPLKEGAGSLGTNVSARLLARRQPARERAFISTPTNGRMPPAGDPSFVDGRQPRPLDRAGGSSSDGAMASSNLSPAKENLPPQRRRRQPALPHQRSDDMQPATSSSVVGMPHPPPSEQSTERSAGALHVSQHSAEMGKASRLRHPKGGPTSSLALPPERAGQSGSLGMTIVNDLGYFDDFAGRGNSGAPTTSAMHSSGKNRGSGQPMAGPDAPHWPGDSPGKGGGRRGGRRAEGYRGRFRATLGVQTDLHELAEVHSLRATLAEVRAELADVYRRIHEMDIDFHVGQQTKVEEMVQVAEDRVKEKLTWMEEKYKERLEIHRRAMRTKMVDTAALQSKKAEEELKIAVAAAEDTFQRATASLRQDKADLMEKVMGLEEVIKRNGVERHALQDDIMHLKNLMETGDFMPIVVQLKDDLQKKEAANAKLFQDLMSAREELAASVSKCHKLMEDMLALRERFNEERRQRLEAEERMRSATETSAEENVEEKSSPNPELTLKLEELEKQNLALKEALSARSSRRSRRTTRSLPQDTPARPSIHVDLMARTERELEHLGRVLNKSAEVSPRRMSPCQSQNHVTIGSPRLRRESTLSPRSRIRSTEPTHMSIEATRSAPPPDANSARSAAETSDAASKSTASSARVSEASWMSSEAQERPHWLKPPGRWADGGQMPIIPNIGGGGGGTQSGDTPPKKTSSGSSGGRSVVGSVVTRTRKNSFPDDRESRKSSSTSNTSMGVAEFLQTWTMRTTAAAAAAAGPIPETGATGGAAKMEVSFRCPSPDYDMMTPWSGVGSSQMDDFHSLNGSLTTNEATTVGGELFDGVDPTSMPNDWLEWRDTGSDM